MQTLKKMTAAALSAAMIMATAPAALADGPSGAYTGKGGSAHAGTAWNNCPWDQRGMYRGSLYCRVPVYGTVSRSHPHCPPQYYTTMYRGSLYCFPNR